MALSLPPRLIRLWQRLSQRAARLGRLLGIGHDDEDATASGNISIFTLSIIRWVAVIGQLFTILFVHLSLGVPLPIGWLLMIVAAAVLLNLVMLGMRQSRTRLSQRRAVFIFAFDIVQLGLLLGLTGGLANPFSLLLLLPVALAATTLRRGPIVALTGLTLLTVALLVRLPVALPWIDGFLTLPSLYVAALWLALSLAVLLVAWHMLQIAEDGRRQANAYEAVQLALAREQELSALGGQAAAVAHALGTPLATINVVAKEMVRELPPDSPLAEDARTLLSEAQRCRDVLSTLGRRDDGPDHVRFTAMPLSVHLREIAAVVERPGIETHIEVAGIDAEHEPKVSFTPEIRHAFGNLIENAISFAAGQVELTLAYGTDSVEVTIDDDGPGFAPEVLDWLGEPYLSGRRRSGGLGLGVFIANSLLARTGARLHFDNLKTGARVRIRWPAGAFQRVVEAGDGRGGVGESERATGRSTPGQPGRWPATSLGG